MEVKLLAGDRCYALRRLRARKPMASATCADKTALTVARSAMARIQE